MFSIRNYVTENANIINNSHTYFLGNQSLPKIIKRHLKINIFARGKNIVYNYVTLKTSKFILHLNTVR